MTLTQGIAGIISFQKEKRKNRKRIREEPSIRAVRRKTQPSSDAYDLYFLERKNAVQEEKVAFRPEAILFPDF